MLAIERVASLPQAVRRTRGYRVCRHCDESEATRATASRQQRRSEVKLTMRGLNRDGGRRKKTKNGYIFLVSAKKQREKQQELQIQFRL